MAAEAGETARAASDGLILDSWAVLAWMQDEPAAEAVDQWFEEAATGTRDLRCSVINAGEVFYQLVRAGKLLEADRFWRGLVRGEAPLRVVAATIPRVKRAAAIKARYPMADADAFAVALAVELGWPLVTGDPEIRRAEADGVVRLHWLGK